MELTNKTETLNQKFQMIGLSADWVFQTWLISGTKNDGIVIFENEDSSCYEVIEFHCKDEERTEKLLFSGDFREIETYILNMLNTPLK
ncbi:hypothetical protein [Aeromonas salmonicida]|uniref:hypothetical protein n=1 Tax=Aeromonas salmonicida TaxID=645 RepID=UPI00073AED74|nr:hypothetical protein [Aeromonas salmonicida]KTA79450.1 hypothetical protein VO69_17900 [Aeromonas salmonicida]MDE7529122.1 hypothetical protein [Aeromonas salmonicida]MDE7533457.1 hypothetical protein [Aeromonas salmonicida]